MADAAKPISLHLTLLKMGVCIALAAMVGTFATHRFKRAGEWLPTVPDTVGIWESVDSPIGQNVLQILGNPKATGKLYYNAFGDNVVASVMAVGPFENYHDPMVCVAGGGGYYMTSKKEFLMDGPKSGKVRAMIFKARTGDVRMLMYYWQQNRDGSTDTAARMGNYRDIQARFDTGYGAVIKGHQTCLMRVYSFIPPDDINGEQTQRNVAELSRTLYHHLRKEGGVE